MFVRGADGVAQFGREPGARADATIGIATLSFVGFALYLGLPRMFPGKAERLDEYGSGPLVA